MVMESVDPVERRQYNRVPLDMKIEIYHIHDGEPDPEASAAPCRGRDVSGGGISFYSKSRHKHDNLLRLQIPLQPEEHPECDPVGFLKVMGKVVWCKKQPERGEYLTGVQFLNIYEKDFEILNDFVQNRLHEREPFTSF